MGYWTYAVWLTIELLLPYLLWWRALSSRFHLLPALWLRHSWHGCVHSRWLRSSLRPRSRTRLALDPSETACRPILPGRSLIDSRTLSCTAVNRMRAIEDSCLRLVESVANSNEVQLRLFFANSANQMASWCALNGNNHLILLDVTIVMLFVAVANCAPTANFARTSSSLGLAQLCSKFYLLV